MSTILIPTSMVDSMNPVVALALAGKETKPQKANGPVPLSPDTRKGSVVRTRPLTRHQVSDRVPTNTDYSYPALITWAVWVVTSA